jgi:hypothetical protein
MHRRLVACSLVEPYTMQITASDGEVWLLHVERDKQGKPIPEQIDRWLNLIWAPPAALSLIDSVNRPSRSPP